MLPLQVSCDFSPPWASQSFRQKEATHWLRFPSALSEDSLSLRDSFAESGAISCATSLGYFSAYHDAGYLPSLEIFDGFLMIFIYGRRYSFRYADYFAIFRRMTWRKFPAISGYHIYLSPMLHRALIFERGCRRRRDTRYLEYRKWFGDTAIAPAFSLLAGDIFDFRHDFNIIYMRHAMLIRCISAVVTVEAPPARVKMLSLARR